MTRDEFVKTRVGFYIRNGVVSFQTERKSTLDWMRDDCCLSEDLISTTIRGGIFKNRIMFCEGVDYVATDMSRVTIRELFSILRKHNEVFGQGTVEIQNGNVVGEVGTAWEPIEVVGSVSLV